MSTVRFDLRKFLFDRRLTISHFSADIGLSYQTVYVIVKRGTAKLSFVKMLEATYGNLSEYILENEFVGVADGSNDDPVETIIMTTDAA